MVSLWHTNESDDKVVFSSVQKKDTKKKEKKQSSPLFFLWLFFGGDRSRLSLSQSSLRDPLLPVVVVVVSKARLLRDHRIIIGWNGRVWWWCWGSPPFFDPGESASSSSSSKIQNAFPENESKNRIAFWTRIMRKTNAAVPLLLKPIKRRLWRRTQKTMTTIYSIVVIPCAWTAPSWRRTAWWLATRRRTWCLVFVTTTTTRASVQKKTGEFSRKKKRRFCLGLS